MDPAGSKVRAMAIAWFRREDYQRIREISDDQMAPTFDQFEAKMTQKLAGLKAPGDILEKVIVDPDELLAFARQNHGGKINSNVRGQFAAWLIMQKYGTNH
jgi:hypothetical protein